MGLFDPPTGDANPLPDPPAPSAVLDAVVDGGEAAAEGASDAAADVAGEVADAASDPPTPHGVTFDPPSNPVDLTVTPSPTGPIPIPYPNLDGAGPPGADVAEAIQRGGEVADSVLEAAPPPPTPVIDVDLDPENHSAAIDVGVRGGDVEIGDTANVSLDHGTFSVDDGRYVEVDGDRAEVGVTASAKDGGVFDDGVYAEVDGDRTEVGITATRPLAGRNDEGVYVEDGGDRTEVGFTSDPQLGADRIGGRMGFYSETSDGGRDQATIHLAPAAPSPIPLPDDLDEHYDPGEGAAADPPSFEAQAAQEVAIVSGTVAEGVESADDAGLPTPDADDLPGSPADDTTVPSAEGDDDDGWDTTADGTRIEIDFGEPVEALEELPDLDDTMNPDLASEDESTALTPPDPAPDSAPEPNQDPTIGMGDPPGSDGADGDSGSGDPNDSGLLEDVGDAIGGVVDSVGDAIGDLFD